LTELPKNGKKKPHHKLRKGRDLISGGF